VPLWTGFDSATAAMQFVERAPGSRRSTPGTTSGVDGIAMPLVLLTTFMTPLVVIAGLDRHREEAGAVLRRLPDHGRADGGRVRRARRAAVLRVLGSDADPDVHHHRHLGRARRVYATIKFFLYTFLGSVFMLVALIYMYLQSGSYAIADFQPAARA
jgi:NADH-quinone oxidoreductase subunit M